ncbi:MAG: hypothetical protein JO250_20635 [Armatimonadetes bacterium]|nr:hypothetical protein [Armatimonadota bacterium]
MPAPASANGAMGLALATFDWGPWLAYVAVTVAFEAAAMGWWLRIPPARALGCSLKANTVTALIRGLFSGIACAFLGFYGNQLNPDPFGRSLLLFTGFGVLSALAEARFWGKAANWGKGGNASPGQEATAGGPTPPRPWHVVSRCLAVHLAGVPVGLAVLLIPSRPYPGLEAQVYATRVYYLEDSDLRRALREYVTNHQAVPNVHSYGELLSLLRPGLGRFAHAPDLWAAAYVPDYRRFDTTEGCRSPIEWNGRAAGRRPYDDDGVTAGNAERPLWLIRSRQGRFCHGLVLEGDLVKSTHDPRELGYDDTPARR